MISAVWSARGAADARRRLQMIICSFGRPRTEWQRGNGILASFRSVRDAGECADARGVFVGALGRRSPSGHDFDAGEPLTGNFALLGWHRSGGGHVVAARGTVGGEPLYIGREGDAWIASSRLEAVVAALDETPAFDPTNLALTAAGLVVDGDPSRRTPYANIVRLRSGERAILPLADPDARLTIWTNEGVDDTFDEEPDRLADDLWRASRESVGRAMAGARTVGVLAGGGLDSSGLLAAAVAAGRELGVSVVPLAIDFAGPGDDRPHRAALEKYLGVQAVTVRPEDAAAYLAPSLVVDGRPSLYPSLAIVCAAVAAGKRLGIERVLTGFLGDLVLDAPPDALVAQLVSGAPSSIRGALAQAARTQSPWSTAELSFARVLELLVHPLVRPHVPTFVRATRRRRHLASLVPWSGPVTNDLLASLARSISPEPSLRTAPERFVSLSTNIQMVEQIEARAQLEILCGVPFREPWMDDAFVRHIARIPPWLLRDGDRDRGLFRRALRGQVPESLRLRPDKAEIEPALDRMLPLAHNQETLARLAAGTKLVDRGILAPDRLQRAATRFFARAADDETLTREGATWTALWPALATEALLESRAS